MTTTLNKDMTVKDVLEHWPETLDVFIANGFEHFHDEKQRNAVAAFLKLDRAAKTKNYDLDNFLGLLQEKIDEQLNLVDVTMKTTQKSGSSVNVTGLLPCPVRLPLLEGFDTFIKKYTEETGNSVSYKLEAASVGADWIETNIQGIEDAADLPDIFLSAGFETFFDQKTIGRFKDQAVFTDITQDAINKDFSGINIKDPKKDYSIIAAVPAVFMVNHDVRGDLPIPRRWADLLQPEFEQNVALPVGDFDLFNAILLALHKEHGDQGIEKLGRCMLKSMHPSQMVKNAKRVAEEKPYVTIMPYFFTKMARMVKSLEIVWPEDGAVVSPIFMLTKKASLDKVKPIAEFLSSQPVGEILAQKGLFPSLHPDVDNQLDFDHPWKWIGWDYIYQNDIGALIKHTTKIFEASMNAT
ncbi:MAG: ABC transporter substrate-binding protein [Deltaproteobacteria bacterium]|jgi:ABC-type Fe3+ transport system substrate-binding protein|nr:ABC transporter substrate-binding protein [Deltaproteobacteria bacterium]MCW9049008.1 ABC transporter substrate-binding protein [Deltaproteobacteria bacterium]